MSLEQQLQQFGLEGKKAKIYIAALELGTAKAFDIAKKAKVERPTAYDILTKLTEDGLIGSYQKKGVKYFIAEDPEKIQKNYLEKQRSFEQILPELKSVYNSLHTKPKIKYYEGISGVKTIFEDTLTSKNKTLRSIFSVVDLFQVPGKEYIEGYVKRRIDAGFKIEVIRSQQKNVQGYWPSTDPEERRTLRFAPSHMVFDMTTYLYDNKVGLISSKKENFGILIESEEFSQTMNHLFDALWQVSKQA